MIVTILCIILLVGVSINVFLLAKKKYAEYKFQKLLQDKFMEFFNNELAKYPVNKIEIAGNNLENVKKDMERELKKKLESENKLLK
jgi:hypothetical protein